MRKDHVNTSITYNAGLFEYDFYKARKLGIFSYKEGIFVCFNKIIDLESELKAMEKKLNSDIMEERLGAYMEITSLEILVRNNPKLYNI